MNTTHNTRDSSPSDQIEDVEVNASVPAKEKPKRGNSQDATRLRISENMTVTQLQTECRFRNISGISGKNKNWLLQQLKKGSVWKSAPSLSKSTPIATDKKATKSTSEAKPTTGTSKAPKNGVAKRGPGKTTKVSKKGSTVLPVKTVKGGKQSSKSAAIKRIASTDRTTSKAGSTPTINWPLLPRITSALTVIQLKHEYMHRLPKTTTGLSNKSKTWFLDELGEDSVWTTCPELSGNVSIVNAARVSKSMTVAQLVHELLTRTPSTKGLSNKSKDDLLKRAGVGSVWTTASTETCNVSKKEQPAKGKQSSGKIAKETSTKKEAALAGNPKAAIMKVATATAISTKKKKEQVKVTKVAGRKAEATTASTSRAKAAPIPVKLKDEPTTVERTSGPKKALAAQKLSQHCLAKVPSVLPPEAPSSSQNAVTSVSPVKRPVNVSSGMIGLASKKAKVEEIVLREGIPVVTSRMTVDLLKSELKARYPNIKGISGKSKDWLISKLGAGSQVLGSAQYKEKADIEAAKLHTCVSLCHPDPLADSKLLRAPAICGLATSKRRVDACVCNVEHSWICQRTPYVSCEPCDYDICKACYNIDSLPPPEKEEELARRCKEKAEEQRRREEEWQRREEAERQREERMRLSYERQREERLQSLCGDDLQRFPSNIKKPDIAHSNARDKFKYTVWTCDVHRKQDGAPTKEFNSSFATLEEANLRAEYVFYYDNPWGCDKDEVDVDNDEVMDGGLRYIRSEPDGGGSWTASVLPSAVFSALDDISTTQHEMDYMDSGTGYGQEARAEHTFAKHVRSPPAKHTDERQMLKYTVWQSDGYDNDGWHSYDGPPEKEFNSSYATVEEANERVEYVFYYKNPWGSHDEEYMFAETDRVTSQGFRFLECCPPDSGRWTVSVVPSIAFEYINL